jgi:hypothetical protein
MATNEHGLDFKDEKASVDDLRRRLVMSDFFRVFEEVPGKSTGLWHIQQQKRIDMILVPTEKALKAGWSQGFVGVECKRSGRQLDEAMLQAIGYMECVWTISGGGLIVLSNVFVWPFYWPKNSPHSARMQGARVGVIEPLFKDGFRMMKRDGNPMLSWTPQAGLRSVLE